MMESPIGLQILLSALTVLGAGISVYVGVKVALAEIKSKQAQHDKDLEDHDDRLKYLERERRERG